jgi:hypothetical protein
MAFVVKDRVKETTTTTGTGTVTLAGASTGFQSFSVIGDGNTTFYTLVSGNDWEVGIGTYTASGTTLSRDTVLESSNSGSAITLSGTSDVFCTYPAEKSVNTDDIGVTVQGYDADTAKYDDTTANFTGTLQNGGSNVVVDSDIGSTVQGYDANTAKYDDTTANFTGTLQNGGSNVVVDSDIGSTVQAYDATILVDADIGSSVQAYDADTAKYDDATANFTGNLQKSGANVLTANQTITLSGDASGSGTTSIVVTVADDSHNHVISNVDGLQTALDAKAPLASPTFTGTATFDTNVLYVDSSGNRVGILNNATDITGTSLDQLIVGSGSGNNGTVIDSGSGGQSRYGFSEAGTIVGGIQYDGTSNQIEFMVEGIGTEVASINSAGTLSATTFSGNLTGNVTGDVSGSSGSCTGNAATATKWATGRTISLTGDVTGTSASFDGSGNASITATVADDSHNHIIGNVDGLQTALDGKQPLDADLTTIGGLAKTDGNFIVGNGTTWVAESGATARTSLGLGSLATLSTVNAATITDNSVGAAELNVSGNGTSGQFLQSDGDGTFTWADAGGGFPSGTRMAFQQTAAPTGWTKQTAAAINDALLRLVTGTVSSGGSTAFSTYNSATTTGATTLSTAQIPSHTHSYTRSNYNISGGGEGSTAGGAQGTSTGATGGNGSHTHSLTKSIKYYDFIVASKD